MKRKFLSFLLVMIMLVTNTSMFVTSYAANIGTFTVSSVSGKAGETVTVNVSISNNPGIVATKLSFSYDKAMLTLLSVEDKGLLGTGSFVAGNNLSLIPYSVTWEDSLSSTNHTSNGVIASLTFKISDTASTGTYSITISYDAGSTFDTNLDDVKFNTVNGAITVSCNHSWGSWTTTAAATCTKDGVQTRTCSACKATETKAITKTGHTVVTDKAVAATCTTAGKTEGSHCSKCNTVITAQQTIAALGHSWGSWATTTAVTCTKDGVQTRTCSRCSTKETKAITATGHTVVTDKAVAATCTTAGKTEGSHCSKCNTVITAQQTIAALGHSWGSWATTTAATCTKDGVQTRTCSACKATETKAITKIGHTVVTDKAVAATCTTAGKTEGSHCSKCNTVIIAQQTVAALGHSWGSWTTTTAATCTKDGVQTRTCATCKATETKTIAATGHTVVTGKAVAATCTTAGKTEGSHCSKCNTVIKAQTAVPATGHKDGEWKITTPATYTSTGEKTLYCAVCGVAIRTEKIPMLTADAPAVKSVDIGSGNMEINYNRSYTFVPVIEKNGDISYKVEYSSSNPDCVSIDANGTMFTNQKGSATITCTVTDANGNVFTDTCNVNVTFTFWQWVLYIVCFGWIWM